MIIDLPAVRELSEQRRGQLFQAITEEAGSAPLGRARKRVAITAGVAVGLTALGTGAAAAVDKLQARPVTNTQTARCYSEAVLGHGGDFPGTSISQAGTTRGPAQVRDALDVCASLWAAGILQAGNPSVVNHPPAGPHAVPSLVACTMRDGSAAIFPGSPEVCARLGLAPMAANSATK
jgi:hypothetical protein